MNPPCRARGKREGFSPGAAKCHSPSARIYTEFPPKKHFFFTFFDFSLCTRGMMLKNIWNMNLMRVCDSLNLNHHDSLNLIIITTTILLI